MMPATLPIYEHTPADPLEYMRHAWRKGYGAGAWKGGVEPEGRALRALGQHRTAGFPRRPVADPISVNLQNRKSSSSGMAWVYESWFGDVTPGLPRKSVQQGCNTPSAPMAAAV